MIAVEEVPTYSHLFSNLDADLSLQQYFSSLRIKFQNLKHEHADIPEWIADFVEEALNGEKSWSKGHEIEQHLALISDEYSLDLDIQKCLSRCKAHFDDTFLQKYIDRLQASESEDQSLKIKRAILKAMLSELHSHYAMHSERFFLGVSLRVRIAFVFAITISLFIGCLCFIHFNNSFPPQVEMIPLVLVSGALGASFSMLAGVKRLIANASLEEMEVLKRYSYIVKRLFIGIGAAIVAYFLIQSNVLSGILSHQLVPDLPIKSTELANYPNISKLLVWSILAGFSEMLVPNLLLSVRDRLNDKKTV